MPEAAGARRLTFGQPSARKKTPATRPAEFLTAVFAQVFEHVLNSSVTGEDSACDGRYGCEPPEVGASQGCHMRARCETHSKERTSTDFAAPLLVGGAGKKQPGGSVAAKQLQATWLTGVPAAGNVLHCYTQLCGSSAKPWRTKGPEAITVPWQAEEVRLRRHDSCDMGWFTHVYAMRCGDPAILPLPHWQHAT